MNYIKGLVGKLANYISFKKLTGRDISFGRGLHPLIYSQFFISSGGQFLKGVLISTVYLKFQGILLLGKGTRFNNPRTIEFRKICRIGSYSKIFAFTRSGIRLGNNFSLGAFSVLTNGFNHFSKFGSLNIGNNVGIGEYCYICAVSDVVIGNDTIVGQYLSVHPQNHNFSARSELIRLQGTSEKGVKIGNNCWIGSKVTFLDGSSVGDGCIVAAGAVVNSVFPDNVIVGGCPAKKIGNR
jgi:acetyltransferase-like isoleucine patch superfamily enzyme